MLHSTLSTAYFALGGYTKSKNNGIHLLKCTFSSDKTLSAHILQTVPLKNCTYLTLGFEKFLFSITEKGVAVYEIVFNQEAPAQLIACSQLTVAQQTGCHLYFRKKSNTLYVASYHDGRLQRYQFDAPNKTLTLQEELEFKGSSIQVQQQSAHLHYVQCSKNEDTLYLCDLGSDFIYVASLEENGALGSNIQKIQVPTLGAGPRHLVFSPCERFFYVHCELNNSLLVYKKEGLNFILLQELFILDEAQPFCPDIQEQRASVNAAGAAIRLSQDGRFLYTSTRFIHLISVFERDAQTGTLRCIQALNSGGLTPRDFNFSPKEDYLLVAHQDSHQLVFFERILEGEHSGTLKKMDFVLEAPECTCILPLK